MKIAVSSYSYSNLIGNGKLTLLGCISKGKEAGFDAIEFSEFGSPENTTLEEYAKTLADECKRINFPVSNFAISLDFINGSEGDLDKEIIKGKRMVDIAVILGAPSLRHDIYRGFDNVNDNKKGFYNALPRLVEGCLAVSKYAKEKGIKTSVENHGLWMQESRLLEQLVNEVNYDNFGLLIDTGNFLCADEEPTKAVALLAKYASYVHIKDFYIKSGAESNPGRGYFKSRAGNYLKGTIIGHGNVKIEQCLSILAANSYDGYISYEFEGIEENYLALEIGLENLKKYIAMLKQA